MRTGRKRIYLKVEPYATRLRRSRRRTGFLVCLFSAALWLTVGFLLAR